MTDLETPPAAFFETGQIEAQLEFAQKQLGSCLSNPRVTPDEYISAMCGYINAYQEYCFGEAAEPRFASYDDMAAQLSDQVTLIASQRGSTFDVRQRIEEYRTDDWSESLKRRGISEAPRVVTLTLADMIDDHLPQATVRRWRSKT